jgi:glycosyltransferase involved in cell wall biosynthesis
VKIAWLGHQRAIRGDGLTTYSREVVRSLRARGVQVLFLHHGDEKGGEGIYLGALATSRRVVIPLPRTKRRMAELLRAERVDLVHASLSFSALDFQLPELCGALGLPLVATFHVGYDPRASLWTGLHTAVHRLYAGALGQFDRVITFSEGQRAALQRFGVPAARLAVIPNGVDVDRYRPAPIPTTLPVIVYCGRLDPDKQVEALCRVVSAWDGQASPRLVLVGGGSEQARLRDRFGGARITFSGWVPDEELRLRTLQAAAIFALPSRVEGMSLALLEAMACGLAIVATDVGGHPEVVAGAGLLLDPSHLPAQLPAALELLLLDPAFRRELGGRARRRAVERYSLAASVDRVMALYREVLAEPPRSRHHLAALAKR